MAFFPKIQSPCPYKGKLSEILEGDVCRLCKREVFDLTFMTDGERREFLAACTGEVCVSYAVPLRPAMAAAAMAVAAMGLPATASAQEAAEVNLDTEEMVIFVGGIKDPANAEYVEDPADASLPELPVVYEDESSTRPTSADGARPETPAPVSSPAAT